MTRRTVCILGLDTVREKTLYQTRWLADRGFDVHVLAMHRDAGSHTADPSARITTLEGNPLARTRQTFRYLATHRGGLHHVELYVGGRFAFVHALLTRLLRIPLLVIERGDILLVHKRAYDLATRVSIRLCYRLANRIWYREVYMERMLAAMGRRNTFLLPNAVPVPDDDAGDDAPRDLDVVWVNRMIPERRPDEFARVLGQVARTHALRAAVVGLSTDPPAERVRRMEEAVTAALQDAPGVSVESFADPHPYYRRARYFVLHGEIVFANFALLEAMARGVVPIVSGVEGADRIVRDGVEGLVYRPGEEGLQHALERALAAPCAQWEEWSRAARARIVDEYSLDAWGRRLLQEYDVLVAERGAVAA